MRDGCVKSKTNVVPLRTENNQNTRSNDLTRWSFATILLLAALGGNYYFRDFSFILRTLGWAALLVLAVVVAATTNKGRWVIQFFRESRQELRKVVWPTREETMQTTLVVAVMVAILSVLLWGVDGVLVWLIGLLTGQRG